MPSENRWRHLIVFLAAAGMGLIGMVVLPKQCAKKPEAEVARAVAPAPGLIESRSKPKGNASKSASDKTADAGSHGSLPGGDFRSHAVSLSQQPLDDSAEALDDLMAKWVATDPLGAAEYVRQLPAGDFRDAAGVSLCQSWAAEHPEDAAAWVTKNLFQGGLQGALGAVASVWAHKAPDATAQWIASLPELADRLVAEGSLAQSWGESNPAAAAVWWKTLPEENQKQALPTLLDGWAVNDPAAAAAWLQRELVGHPESPAMGVVGLVSNWCNRDAPQVSRWLNSLPEGPFYESAVAAFAQSAADTAPKDALLWARALADPAQRQQSVLHTLETWLDNDRAGFIASLPDQLNTTTEPALRQAVYDMLYRKDPNFKTSLLRLADTPVTDGAPESPATDQGTGSPIEGGESE